MLMRRDSGVCGMTINYIDKIICGDCLEVLSTLPDCSVNCCITSPPYWGLRDYGVEGQLGLEKTPEEYVGKMVAVFGEVRRVLKDDGTLWLNLGDSYSGSGKGTWGSDEARENNRSRIKETYIPTKDECPLAGNVPSGLKPKDLVGIPWRVAFALQADGWYLRQDIIWHKPNPMPESVTDRCTKAHEYVFLLSQSARYYYDAEAVKEPIENPGKPRKFSKAGNKDRNDTLREYDPATVSGRNKRSVWTVTTQPFKEAHFAVFPPDLIKPMVLAGCPEGGIILDPFMGSGTTAVVARSLGRHFVGIELNEKYKQMAERRVGETTPSLFMEVTA